MSAARVALRRVRGERVHRPARGPRHPRRLEDVTPHVVIVILARQAFDHESEHDVAGVRVPLLCPGLELQRLVDEQRQVIGQPPDVAAGLARRRGGDVAAHAGPMLQQLPDRDAPRYILIGIVGPSAGQARVDVELARVGELPDRDLCEELVDRPEVERSLDRVGRMGLAIGEAVRPLEHGRAVLREEHGPRELARRDEAVECLGESGGEVGCLGEEARENECREREGHANEDAPRPPIVALPGYCLCQVDHMSCVTILTIVFTIGPYAVLGSRAAKLSWPATIETPPTR